MFLIAIDLHIECEKGPHNCLVIITSIDTTTMMVMMMGSCLCCTFVCVRVCFLEKCSQITVIIASKHPWVLVEYISPRGECRSNNSLLTGAFYLICSSVSHTASMRSGGDPMGSTDTMAISEGSTTVTLDTASSHSGSQPGSCRVHYGSLASFDTNSVLNTEGEYAFGLITLHFQIVLFVLLPDVFFVI